MVKEQYKEDSDYYVEGGIEEWDQLGKLSVLPVVMMVWQIKKKMISREMDRLEVYISIEYIALDRILVTRKKGTETCLSVLIQATE